MIVLCIETSTEACSVALMNSYQDVFSEFQLTPRKHTEYLPVMMESVLNKAEVDKSEISHIAFANGPGAFTGVRIASSMAQGIAIGLKIPMVCISSLAVLAQCAVMELKVESVYATLDARMGEAYCAHYYMNSETGLVELEGEEQLLKLTDLKLETSTSNIGSGFYAAVEAGILEGFDENYNILPHAKALPFLAKRAIDNKKAVSAADGYINYIRNNVAQKKKPRHV
ncbi:MAG: tRNA (adenosine(37)-N6)-threonylcarbamoyltransferase complex dimerization subunit type 1 TsaB [Bacteroidetes bacterium]|nr:tRNA (adenosine(37)-N6)-threonylcarbamoyltransferase complex dimerization subunit type 1 TsaB [Bacteroidota bacterium]